MSKTLHNKLVRDKIPDIILANGGRPRTRILTKQEYVPELIRKFSEKYEELKLNPCVEELADLQEVLLALAEALGISPGQLAKAYIDKAAARGAFKKRIFLESVEF
jgi:predicted house-cleaning noncanonical NTP pyrophosphatase (MazG superfamily)